MNGTTEEAKALGRSRAREILELRQKERTALEAPAPIAGHLIAEGDSWFNYPLHDEVVEKLEDRFNYRVESAAKWGDTAENMAYNAGGEGKALVKPFEKLAGDGVVPRAILLSAGGNDVAGTEFGLLLNHARSQSPGLNSAVVEGVMQRLDLDLTALISLLRELGRHHFGGVDLPLLLHGYGNPVPDGRGFFGGLGLLPGPWLEPAFARKGYDDLAQRIAIMKELIDRFNTLLHAVAAHFTKVVPVDVRPALSNKLEDYKDSWANELHPTGEGFEAVAALFDAAIQGV